MEHSSGDLPVNFSVAVSIFLSVGGFLVVVVISFALTAVLRRMVVHFTDGTVRSAAVIVGSFSPSAAASFLMLGVESHAGGRNGVCVCGGGARSGCLDRACGLISLEGI